MPPVSTRTKRLPLQSVSSSLRSRVTPGVSWTTAARVAVRRLTSVDLPTFGNPTIATVPSSGASASIVLLRERKLGRAGRNFPEVAFRIGEVAAVPAPGRRLRRLGDGGAGALGLGEHLADALLRADVVGERDAAEAVAAGGDARVFGELVPGIEGERGRAALENDADPVVVLLLDRPAEAFDVKVPRAREVPDAERDDADVRLHAGCRARTSSSIWATTS